ncbi:MAG: transcriptional repressor LexA [Thermodesulfobacteriota bacterium]
MKTPTMRQKQILEYLRDYQGEHGYPPSFRETAAHFRINLGSVQDHLQALIRKGYLAREVNRSRGLRLLPSAGPLRTIPLYGAIPAGDPRQIEETAEGYVALPEDWARGREVFLLRVQGDSMSPYILSGDQVIIRRQERLSPGAVGVFRVDGEITLKRFFQEQGRVVLKGENPDFPPLIFKGRELAAVTILGQVIGVYRAVEK